MTAVDHLLRDLRATRAATIAHFSGLPPEALERTAPWRGAPATLRFLLNWLSEGDDALLVRLQESRLAAGAAPTGAQLALPLLGAARGALLGALVGVPLAAYEQPPAEGEWSLRYVLAHVIATDRRYLIAVQYACERQASGRGGPLRPPAESLPPNTGETERHGSIPELLGRLEATRDEVVRYIAAIPDALLDAPTNWVTWDLDVRFRLHRFAAHDREHTIHVRKTLAALGIGQNEPQLLLADALVSHTALEGALAGLPEPLLTQSASDPSLATLFERALTEEQALAALPLA